MARSGGVRGRGGGRGKRDEATPSGPETKKPRLLDMLAPKSSGTSDYFSALGKRGPSASPIAPELDW